MKKSLIATLILGSSLGLTSCGGSSSSTTPAAKEETKSGVYSYTSWSTKYGMAVKVTFSKDKKITKVERDAAKITELGLTEVTQSTGNGWDGEAMKEVYDEKLTESLAKFNNVDANTYYTEAAAALGAINPTDKATFPAKDSAFATKYYVNTGATQSNARLAAAVANACAELLGKTKLAVAQPSSGGNTSSGGSSSATSSAKPSTTPATSSAATSSAATSSAKTSTNSATSSAATSSAKPSTTPAA